jgi:hypothetical protein
MVKTCLNTVVTNEKIQVLGGGLDPGPTGVPGG